MQYGMLFDMILHLPNPRAAAQWCAEQRRQGKSLGFVPTMGALHPGHLSLVHRAVKENEVVCASIFINPLQFNNADDFAHYPRNIKLDINRLEKTGCDMVFEGTLTDFFPHARSTKDIPVQPAGEFAEGLEGAERPGHFDGVRTIVDRLFCITRPDRAYFGEKDFQQTLVVNSLIEDRGYGNLTMIVCPTSREATGLARSSRNRLLSDTERQEAGCIHQALKAARRAWNLGIRDAEMLRREMLRVLQKSRLKIEYADLRDPANWSSESPQGPLRHAQALIAVNTGKIRLIDNMRLDRQDDQPSKRPDRERTFLDSSYPGKRASSF